MKGLNMTDLALSLANRSAAFLSSLVDVLNKTLAMKKAAHPENSTHIDLKKIRAIADTI